jgi:hypothetical protein
MKLLHKIDTLTMLYGLMSVGVNNSDFNSQEFNQNLYLNRVVLGGGVYKTLNTSPLSNSMYSKPRLFYGQSFIFSSLFNI